MTADDPGIMPDHGANGNHRNTATTISTGCVSRRPLRARHLARLSTIAWITYPQFPQRLTWLLFGIVSPHHRVYACSSAIDAGSRAHESPSPRQERMSASDPAAHDHLVLLRGGIGARSARRGDAGTERGQRGKLEPRGKQVEVGVTGGRRSRSGALRGERSGDGERISPSPESDREQSRSVSEPLAHEAPESKPELSFVSARREIGFTAPLLNTGSASCRRSRRASRNETPQR